MKTEPENLSQKKSNNLVIGIVIAVSIVIAIVIAFVMSTIFWSSPYTSTLIPSPYLEIADLGSNYQLGLLSDNIVISGKGVNLGNGASNPITLTITIYNEDNVLLYSTQTSPNPSVVQPGQEATFVEYLSTDDLGGYRGSFEYQVEFTNY
ncbi:MAG: hypothetical protein AB7U98_01155 [Candidatus Nitrosocosmicus sp.]